MCEVTDEDDERPLTTGRDVETVWLHRKGTVPGEALKAAVAELDHDLDASWFVAAEAGAMRAIRAHLLDERGTDPGRVQTRGYWRRGETDYPDHDYGED